MHSGASALLYLRQSAYLVAEYEVHEAEIFTNRAAVELGGLVQPLELEMNIPLAIDEKQRKEPVILPRSARCHVHRSDHTADSTRSCSSSSVAQSDCIDDRFRRGICWGAHAAVA